MLERIVANVEKVIIGKREAVEHTVLALLCGGHVLLEDVPGVGKTMLVRALAASIGCSFQRIQFTPDLMPSDVTGISVYHPRTEQFTFRPGPIMANIVLADELNRTSPRTQAALLEAMEEKRVTMDGETYALPDPFLLLATQNPLDQEGTFALPEAQLDRFLLKIALGYPSEMQELALLDRMAYRHPIERLQPVVLREEVQLLQKKVPDIHVDPSLKEYVVSLTAATRRHAEVRLGASPRATMALMRAAQAKAFMLGRSFCLPDDIKALAVPVLSHRLVLQPEARWSGRTAEMVVEQLLEQQTVPTLRYAHS
ncbi:MoxR family ATPase [Paenibacillus sp. y28]